MRKHLLTACLYTLCTTLLLGFGYPLLITGIARLTMRQKADGQLILRHGRIVGSALIGQPFTGPAYFHSRPSSAGTGYDASASSGSNLGPTNKSLADRVEDSVRAENNGTPVPVDLITSSGSGLDPDTTPAAAMYQIDRISNARHLSAAVLQQLIAKHQTQRQLGLLGEPRVNVLELNLALDDLHASD